MPYQQQQDKRTPTQKGDANHATMSGLLFEIYERWYHKSRLDSSLESDTITEYSTSDAGVYRWTRQDTCSTGSDAEQRQPRRHNETSLRTKDVTELKAWVHDMEHKSNVISSRLVRQLKRRDHRLVRLQKKCDILTAILQASSLKRQKEAERESQRSAERQRQRAQKKAEKDRKRREYLEHKAISDQLEQGDGPEDSDEVSEETPSAELRPTTSSRLSLVTCVLFSALMAFVYVFFFCHEQRSTMCLSLNKHLPAGLIDWRGHVINATTSLLAR